MNCSKIIKYHTQISKKEFVLVFWLNSIKWFNALTLIELVTIIHKLFILVEFHISHFFLYPKMPLPFPVVTSDSLVQS